MIIVEKVCRWNPSNLVRNIWAIYGEHPTIHRRSYTRPLPLLIVKWPTRILGQLSVLAWNPLFWKNTNCNWRDNDIDKYAPGKISTVSWQILIAFEQISTVFGQILTAFGQICKYTSGQGGALKEHRSIADTWIFKQPLWSFV